MALHPDIQKLIESVDANLTASTVDLLMQETLKTVSEASSKPATLSVEGNRLWLESPFYPAAQADIKGVIGRKYDPDPKRWNYPLSEFETVYKLTMLHFPTTKVPMLKLASQVAAGLKSTGKLVTFEKHGSMWAVFSPYNPSFVDGMKMIPGRKWDGMLKAWSFPKDQLDPVINLAKEVYGVDNVSEPTP